LWNEKTEYEQVPDGNKTNPDGSVKMKSQAKTVMDWEKMNTNKPLWLREPRDIEQAEYNEFYKGTFKAFDDPQATIHFKAEGQIEFKCLVFIPNTLPFELTNNMFDESGRAMRLYVKRVFINDKFEDIVPRWLTFLRGVVDSDDLPLNVGREILQKSKTLNLIRKRIVRKVLDYIESLAEKQPAKYAKLWETFGKYFKIGLIEDAESKEALKKIVRFWSSTTGENTTSLGEYVKRMQPGQDKIYFVSGEGKAGTARSPSMEKMKAKNLEVLYLVDPMDEIVIQANPDYQGKKFVDINKGDIAIEQTAEEVARDNVTKMEFTPILKWMKTIVGKDKVSDIKLSNRLVDSMSVIVQASWGMSPTMQRYMRATASQRPDMDLSAMNQAVLEINPEHAVIQKLKTAWETDENGKDAKDLAVLAYDMAALSGGYTVEDMGSFAKRVSSLLTKVQ
jgi:heat shock protein beta